MIRIVCVLRSGGEYRPEHVIRLRDQVARHLAGARFLCLADVTVPGVDCVPLYSDWPGWWAKMELFRPGLDGDLLYMDLDSAIVGDLSEMAGIGRLTIMRDVYRPAGLQSSVMFLPELDRPAVWRRFRADPARWMTRYRPGGDQAFLEKAWAGSPPALWQEQLPGQVVSWKVHVQGRGFPAGARFIAFHGRPRPWEVGW